MLILLLFLIVLLGATAYSERGRHTAGGRAVPEGRRERYGPPPGMYRALSHEELGSRGWPEYPFEFSANSASSISHMIERSA